MMMLSPKIVFRGESAFVDNFKLFDVVLNNGITLRLIQKDEKHSPKTRRFSPLSSHTQTV